MNRLAYAAHRWIGLVALLQLLVWSVTGFFFTVVPITRVRGEDTAVKAAPQPVPWDRVKPLPERFHAGATDLLLRTFDGRAVWEVRGPGLRRLVDAETGAALEIDRDAAVRVARADQVGAPPVRDVVRIEEAPLEYRDRPVPAWRVDLEDGRGTRIYVDAQIGTVTARRNDVWRVYDFLWGLHIMDYEGRHDFNHLLLSVFAALGVLTSVTGAVIWGLRAVRRVRRGRAAGAA